MERAKVGLADDAIAAVEYLATRGDVRRDCIGLVGFSEGASVAPIAASRTPRVSHLVLLAPEAVVGAVGALERHRLQTEREVGAEKELAEQKLLLSRLTLKLLLDGVQPPEIRRQLVETRQFPEDMIGRAIRRVSRAKNAYQYRYDPAPV
ncbi:MAG: hypothetical protein H0X18_17375, partial [Geodermatophilaceae bacterium]|nr:hypothetical protein [Geodermatophilaceae bacterium]